MAIALVAHAFTVSATSTNTSIAAPAINATGATLLVATLASLNNVAVGVTDSQGNTWLPLTGQHNGVTYGQIFYCPNPSVSASLVITGNFNTIPYAAVSVAAFSGTDSNSYKAMTGANAAAVGTIQPGSITPAFNGSLLYVGETSANAGSTLASISTGTILANNGGTPGNSVPIADAYYIQATAAAINPTLTYTSTAGQAVALMACFAPAGSVAPSTGAFFFTA